jgi:L,D-transpeptidase ErfK/SrfK
MRVSHGCIRLYPENIETLFDLVARGETVTIINEPFLAGQLDGEWYFEGHAPLEDDSISPEDRLMSVFERAQARAGEALSVADMDHARAIASEALGVPVRVQLADAAEVFERARLVRNTVEPDPNMPTIEEVRALLDGPLEAATSDE